MLELLMMFMLVSGPNGQDVYKANKCAVCHSIAGVGNKKGPLDGIGNKLSKAAIKEALLNPKDSGRKPAMKPVKLQEAELEALVEYLAGLK